MSLLAVPKASELWSTPQEFFDGIDREFGFTFDVCADPASAKCPKFYTPEDDGLKQPWTGRVWCNPPYSEIPKWMERGHRAVVIHGKLPASERKRALDAHARGAVLVNCMVLTEGWDSPETSVCILARGCGSVSTYLQIVGRVLRPSPGKDHAVLIDLTGRSVDAHGPPDDDREYDDDDPRHYGG